jgi:hypothetical protein
MNRPVPTPASGALNGATFMDSGGLLAPVQCSLLELSGYLQPLFGEISQYWCVLRRVSRFG